MRTQILKFGWIIVLLAGCQKYLDKPLLGVYSNNSFYQTKDQAIQAVNAAYQPLSFTSATSNPVWVFGDVASDDAVKGGNPGDQNDIELIDRFNITPINGNLGNEWGTLYEGITRCNMVLSKVPDISMDDATKTRILGEARFLRAWYYFNLVIIFGEVPVVLEPLNADQLQIPQSTTKVIYESVIEPDLNAAYANLPASYTGADVGRATRGAAMALLAKAYLYQGKWDSSVVASSSVINSNQYQLAPLYSQNFSPLYKNNSESIFEVQMKSGQNPLVGNSLNQWFAPAVYGGYYFDAPTQSFVDEFEKTTEGVYDPRLDYTIGRDSMSSSSTICRMPIRPPGASIGSRSSGTRLTSASVGISATRERVSTGTSIFSMQRWHWRVAVPRKSSSATANPASRVKRTLPSTSPPTPSNRERSRGSSATGTEKSRSASPSANRSISSGSDPGGDMGRV